jgi:DNA-binding MarR family transcriptional regulator
LTTPAESVSEHRILSLVSAGKPVTPRMLARDLGVALGLANRLVRRLIDRGRIEVRRDRRKLDAT